MSDDARNRAHDALLMALSGSRGRSQASDFLMDAARAGKVMPERVDAWIRGPYSLYVPDHQDERVVLFPDGSGAYVHRDGFVTPMGDDIRQEVGAWRLVSGPGPA